MKKTVLAAAVLCVAVGTLAAQQRRFEVHTRGMLRQTVYNTGELGRAYDQGTAGVLEGVPSLEWPANSSFTLDSKFYSGQHNSFGGGVQMSMNRRDTTRMFVFCGGVSSLPVVGVHSFPLSLVREENYPLLPSGELNPTYNPNEAEEKITTSWATPVGITVTRTSRAWSHPDYDDMIIYEYEFENTGDTDGNPATPARQDTLTELVIGFSQGFAPGKTGHERKYNRWNGTDFQQTDSYARFDRQRWLNYVENIDGLPDPQYFTQWAQTGINGGGLQAPMAVGYVMLYYDTTQLAHRTETLVATTTGGSQDSAWNANNQLKQPYLNRLETSLWSEAKHRTNMVVTTWPRSGNSIYSSALFGTDWAYRTSFNVRQSWYFAVGRQVAFGPYVLKPGDKVRFALAEVAGFGAASLEDTQGGLLDEGGSCGQICNESSSANAMNPVVNYRETITYGFDNKVHGSTYLSTYPLPDYVNSEVVTVRDVADRAIQAYLGSTQVVDWDSSQYWPEQAPDHGVYSVPAVVPAPELTVENTDKAQNRIRWGLQAESFTHPRLEAPLSHYLVLKSSHPLGPWSVIDSVRRGDAQRIVSGAYEATDTTTTVLESNYYTVVSVDSLGTRSGKTNMTLHQTQLGGTETLQKVYAVPNPFFVRSGFTGAGNPENRIGFFNLPKECTIRIVSYSGQLIETIEHKSDSYSVEYFRTTRNNQVIASGLYFFIVETPDGKRTHGKFVVIQ